MLTACELCVCATYTGATATSRPAGATPVTSTGGFATSVLLSRPQLATSRTATVIAAARAIARTQGNDNKAAGIDSSSVVGPRPLPPARESRGGVPRAVIRVLPEQTVFVDLESVHAGRRIAALQIAKFGTLEQRLLGGTLGRRSLAAGRSGLVGDVHPAAADRLVDVDDAREGRGVRSDAFEFGGKELVFRVNHFEIPGIAGVEPPSREARIFAQRDPATGLVRGFVGLVGGAGKGLRAVE